MASHPASPMDGTIDDHLERRSLARDPWIWCLVIPALFGALAAIRLTIPSNPFFDEVHYLPAAREWLKIGDVGGARYLNIEHPLLGKQLIALGIYLFGDNPLGWRIVSLSAGVIAIAASMRALWFASQDRFATIVYGILLATGFHLFIHARIAMLDVFMAMFLAIAVWHFAAAMREPENGRWRLALVGIALGAAMGAKWNAVPLAMLPGLVFFAARLTAGRRRLLLSRRGIPVPGVSLLEAFVWLGLVPLIVYAATFLPGYWLDSPYHPSPMVEFGLIGLHAKIIELQGSVIAQHTYQSTWMQWIANTRGIWYLYEFTDNAQRGVLLIGNPVTMLAGLPAVAWCAWSGSRQRDWARLGVAVTYIIAIGFWIIAPKPVQFYYHYTVPSLFLLAALALALSDLARHPTYRWIGWAVLIASLGMFAYFFPILSAGPLENEYSFLDWAWIKGWR